MADVSFACLYFSYRETLAPFTDAERGRIMMAMIDYASTGEVPCFEGNERFIWPTVQAQIERDIEAYENRCAKNRANGAKGGRPKKQTETEETQQTERFSEEPNKANNNDNDKENYKEKDNDNDREKEKIDYNGIVNAYNEICKSLPSVRSLSEARKKAIKARLKTYGMEDFKLLFEKAEASSFLKGKNGNNWSANFDWLIKDANMAKVLDGNYDDKPKFGRRTEAVPSWMSDKPVEDDLDRLERQMAQKTLANDPDIKARADALKERLGC